MKLEIEFGSLEDCAQAFGKIQRQIDMGDGNQLAGTSVSLLLCALSRAKSVSSPDMTPQEAKNIRMTGKK